MSFTYIRRAAVALALIATAGCTVKNTEAPPLTGPSGLALSLTVNAIPDSISQDGGSQSSVKVTAIGPDGKGARRRCRCASTCSSNGVAQDYGTLSARSVVTNSDGVATAVYTAPPSPVNGVFGTCSGLPGNCVSIVATATGTNFATANPEQVPIRLVPTGVILPPAGTPTAAFTISPTPVNFERAGRPSTRRPARPAPARAQIASYAWTFGDGTTGTGQDGQPHLRVASRQRFNVTLTVTNDRGLAASTTQRASRWTPSPAPTRRLWCSRRRRPRSARRSFFNADAVQAGGRSQAACSSAGTSATAHGRSSVRSRRLTSFAR